MSQYLNWFASILPLPNPAGGNPLVLGLVANVDGSGAGQPVVVSKYFSSDMTFYIQKAFWYYGSVDGTSSGLLPVATSVPDLTSLCTTTVQLSDEAAMTYVNGIGTDQKAYKVSTESSSYNKWAPVSPSSFGDTTYKSILYGADHELLAIPTSGLPCILQYWYNETMQAGVATTTSSSFNTGGLAMQSSDPTSYSQLVSVVAGGTYHTPTQMEWIIGLANGTPTLISTHQLGSQIWTNSASSGFSGGSVLFSSLTSFTDSYGNGYLIGLGAEDNLPYEVGRLNMVDLSWVAGSGKPLPTAMVDGKSVPFVALVPVSDHESFELVGLGFDGLPYQASKLSGVFWVAPPTATIPTIKRLGQTVTYASLAWMPGGGGLLGVGFNDGQLYQIATVGALITFKAGQGLMPSTVTTSWLDAEMMVSLLVTTPNLMQGLIDEMMIDIDAATPGSMVPYNQTNYFIQKQANPVTRLFLSCETNDVLAALANAFTNYVTFWSGCYGKISAGTGWPANVTPKYLYITPSGALFYGNFNLAACKWVFANTVLSWEAAPANSGGPPIAGSVEFDIAGPDAPLPGGYVGPYFTGTLNGVLNQPAAGAPTLPTPPAMPAIVLVTTDATLPLKPGQSASVTATLRAAAPYPGVLASVYLSVGNSLSAPDTVLIPAGATATTFKVKNEDPWITFAESKSSTTKSAIVSVAAAGGFASTTLSFTTVDADAGPQDGSFTASVSPEPVSGGNLATLTVTLNSPADGEVILTASGLPNVPAGAEPMQPIIIENNQTSSSIRFPTNQITPGPNITLPVIVGNDDFGNLEVSYQVAPRSAVISVYLLQVDSQNTLGGTPVRLTVTLNQTPKETVTVKFEVQPNNSNAIDPISNVVFLADSSPSQTFTVDTNVVTQDTEVQITAMILNRLPGSGVATESLTVLAVPLSAYTLYCPEVENTNFDVTLILNAPSPGRGTYTIASSAPDVIKPPSDPVSVILQGQTRCSWTMSFTPPTTKMPVTLTVTGTEDTVIGRCTVEAAPYADWIPLAGGILGILTFAGGAAVGALKFGKWVNKKYKKWRATTAEGAVEPAIPEAEAAGEGIAATIETADEAMSSLSDEEMGTEVEIVSLPQLLRA